MRELLKRFWNDERGIAFVFFLVAMPAFIGVSLLAIDIGRGNNLHYDVQKGVDALALAAAAELDGTNGSRDAAVTRLQDMLANRTRFSDLPDDQTVLNAGNVEWRFLKSLPPHDDDEIVLDDHEAESDFEAEFIWVWVAGDNAQPYTTIFPVSLALGSQTVEIGAQAVAGFTRTACDFTPIFMCNPYEGADDLTIYEAAENPEYRRRQLKLRMMGQGNESAYFPGNFAFLENPLGPGADALREALARTAPPACYGQRGVNTKTGQNAGPVRQGLNVRFDIYDGPMNSNRNDPDYRPARNVRKGYVPENNMCNADPAEDGDEDKWMGLARDGCFADNSCEVLVEGEDGARLGDGEWDWEEYWEVNFCHEGLETCHEPSTEWSAETPPTRYEVYRYEIEEGLVDVPSRGEEGPPTVAGETGEPLCSDSATNDSPDRRLLYGAVINCIEACEEIGGCHGNVDGLPVETFARFFLTEPVRQGGSDATIWAELEGLVGTGDGPPSIRDEAVLYR